MCVTRGDKLEGWGGGFRMEGHVCVTRGDKLEGWGGGFRMEGHVCVLCALSRSVVSKSLRPRGL